MSEKVSRAFIVRRAKLVLECKMFYRVFSARPRACVRAIAIS